MKFTLEINCSNSAFEDNANDEIARILEALAKKINAGECLDHSLRDSNGNKVGFCFAEK
jgi:hypothetical protein